MVKNWKYCFPLCVNQVQLLLILHFPLVAQLVFDHLHEHCHVVFLFHLNIFNEEMFTKLLHAQHIMILATSMFPSFK